MENYSDAVLERVKGKVSAWAGEFEKSPEYASLSSAQKKESRAIVDIFAELMYNYYLEEPESWTVIGLRGCCLDLFPRKLAVEPEFYEAVEPVLTAFFAYLQRKGYISNAAELTPQLKRVAGEMIRRANRPSNWELAKSFIMRAIRSGVDLTNEVAFNRYVEKHNEQILRNEQTRRSEDSTKRAKKVGRNDPCPCGSGKKYKKCCGSTARN